MKSKEPTKREKDEYTSSWKTTHIGPPNGGVTGIIKGFKIVKRIRIHKGRFIINVLISVIPIIFGIILPSFFLYSILLSIIVFLITGFILRPYRTIEIDTENF